ncbi:MAG: hypothetical protein B1H03_06475 [Planctomycetales bacterium 4484_113]|nr:MAG: hypothetical protein B1H03_06475 [Planctomycetales bacterium 4484_113]
MMKSLAFRRLALVLPVAIVALTVGALSAAADEIPSISEPMIIKQWRTIGPFPIGVREAGTSPLAYFGKQPFENPLLQGAFPSYLAHNAEVRWKYVQSDENGRVTIDYPDITEDDWKLVTDEWGFAGALYSGIAYGAIVLAEGPRRALVDLQISGGFRLNDIPYQGDAYGHKLWQQPVVLKEGRNEFRVGFSYRGGFTLRILPVEDDVMFVAKDATLPDLVRGEQQRIMFSVPIINATTDWLREPWIRLKSDIPGLEGTYRSDAAAPPQGVLCFQVRYGPTAEVPATFELDEAEVKVELLDGKGGAVLGSDTLKFRVRDPAQSRRETFWSPSTNSVQYYGLKPPKDYDPQKRYALVLSLHGAGCEAGGQVDAYEAKEWAFVAAPTNCRRFGFDWQDWGSLNMLETLAAVMRRYPIEMNRVHLTGHSMGGHGTWFNSFVYPDLWADVVPSAGWTTFGLYVPMFLRKNITLGPPRAQLIWNLAMRDENTLMLTENALNLPILAVEGSADDNVPPQQPKMLVDLLTRRGYDISFREEPGMGHWWNIKDTPGTDCVDASWINDFWKKHTRNPWPEKVVYRTHNYSMNNRAYWVTIDRPLRAYADIKVEAEVIAPREVRVKTTNIEGITLRLPEKLIGGIKAVPEAGVTHGGKVIVNLDRERFVLEPTADDTYSFHRGERGVWQLGEVIAPPGAKTRKLYGPWKQAFMRPFVIVYGTQGTDEEDEWALALARAYAHAWWYRGNGRAVIVADTELIPQSGAYPNLILLGGAKMNAVTARLEPKLPIKMTDEGVIAGTRLIRGKDLAAKFVYPNPEHPDTLVLVQEGQSLKGFKRLFSFTEIYSGGGFPDWMVWGDEVKLMGLGGARAMGFFDMNWRFSADLTFWSEELNR